MRLTLLFANLLVIACVGCGGTTSPSTDAGTDAAKTSDALAEGGTCSGEGERCAVRDDCCNSRHSCIAGACWYSAPADAGVPDVGVVRYEGEVQPLLWDRCAACHDGDAGLPAFATSYAVMSKPSTLCPGETIGQCVSRALRLQMPEGSGCRTYEKPFHREGWKCLTKPEIDKVVAWVAGGMPER